VNARHGLHESLPRGDGVGVEAVHIVEELPGVVVHHAQNMEQALVAFGVDVQGLGAELRQGAADEMGKGEADGDFSVVLVGRGLDELQAGVQKDLLDLLIPLGAYAFGAEDDFIPGHGLGRAVGAEHGVGGQDVHRCG